MKKCIYFSLMAFLSIQLTLVYVTPTREIRISTMLLLVISLVILTCIYIKCGKLQKYSLLLFSTAGILAFISVIELVFDYQFFNAWNWIASAVVGMIYVGAFTVVTRSTPKIIFEHVFLFVAVFFICLTCVSIANVELDPYKRNDVIVTISDKEIFDTGRFNSIYEFDIKANIEGEEKLISVPYAEYIDFAVGDSIDITVCKGLFNQPYYYYKNQYKELIQLTGIVNDEEGELFELLQEEGF